MGCFNSIFCLLGVLRDSAPRPLGPNPVALESSKFSKLPPELILYIARFLLPESILSFSLSCRPIYFTFGKQHFETLAQNSYCFEFLKFLARDLPDHVPCYYCRKLHAIKKARQHIFLDRNDCFDWFPCWRANYGFTLSHLYKNFSFTVSQMALKRYGQGLNYSELLNLLSYNETCHQGRYIEHHTALAKIINGSMLVREQKLVIVPLIQPGLIHGTQIVPVCPHISLRWNLRSRGLHGVAERLHSLSWDVPKIDWNWQGLVRRCTHCLTDFCFDFKQLEGKAEAIFVTKWQDLGQSGSPWDYRWKDYVARREDRGSICSMFEGKKYSRFQSDGLLTQQERERLLRLVGQVVYRYVVAR